jgi:hypothetical protein
MSEVTKLGDWIIVMNLVCVLAHLGFTQEGWMIGDKVGVRAKEKTRWGICGTYYVLQVTGESTDMEKPIPSTV